MKRFKILAGSLALLAFFENLRELHGFQVTEYAIASEKLADLKEEAKILFLSDLHNHRYGKENEWLLAAVRKTAPDLILIGGDMLVGKNGHPVGPALEFVKKLPSIAPVYYANGNHEQRMKEHPDRYEESYFEYKEALENAGAVFLENQTVECPLKGAGLRLTGLEIPMDGYTRFHKRELEQSEIKERIGACDTKEFSILLAHNPSYIEEYARWGADLILSGHFHGGLVRLPGIGAVLSPSFQLFPPYSGGRYREGNQEIIVSRGLGTHTFHIRLGNPAEAVLLRLKGTSRDCDGKASGNTCAKGENPV